MKTFIRNSRLYAFIQGFCERWKYGDDFGFGRTHQMNQGWNEAYDHGANLSDLIYPQ